MEQFGRFVAGFALLVFSTVLFGFTFSVLWGWFIVPTFGADPLTLPQALGLATIKGYLFYKRNDKEEKVTFERVVKVVAESTILALFTLGLGYLYTLFM